MPGRKNVLLQYGRRKIVHYSHCVNLKDPSCIGSGRTDSAGIATTSTSWEEEEEEEGPPPYAYSKCQQSNAIGRPTSWCQIARYANIARTPGHKLKPPQES